MLQNGVEVQNLKSGIKSFAVIPKGSKNIKLRMQSGGNDDDLQIVKRNGEHIIGTSPFTSSQLAWYYLESESGSYKDASYINSNILTESNGFTNGAVYSNSRLNSTGNNLPYNDTHPYNQFTIDGMNIKYSGSGVQTQGEGAAYRWRSREYLEIDEVTDDIVVLVLGGPPSSSEFHMYASWDTIGSTEREIEETIEGKEGSTIISISTQELAQKALNKINDAIVTKDNIRAHLGAMQNRLENTITNITTQAENLQAAESRISDVDVATEMTEFVRQQILAQSAVAMLSQANSMPKMAMQIIGG